MAAGPLGARIGEGKEAEVFDAGTHVVKLYRDAADKPSAFREAAILALVEGRDLPVPPVLGVASYGGRWGVAMGRASGQPFAVALQQPGSEAVLDAMARLHALVHRRSGAGLPSQHRRLRDDIARAPRLGDGLRRRLLEALAAMPEGDRLCHGDFHPFNVLGTPEAATIVDWLDASQGDPAADLCRSYVLMERGAEAFARRYVAAYSRQAGIPAEAVFRWLPLLAAARLSEGVPQEEPRLIALAETL